jgi:hypothetical protein
MLAGRAQPRCSQQRRNFYHRTNPFTIASKSFYGLKPAQFVVPASSGHYSPGRMVPTNSFNTNLYRAPYETSPLTYPEASGYIQHPDKNAVSRNANSFL